MKEVRCRKCNRLLMKGDILQIEIKCPKCGYVQGFKRKNEGEGNKSKGEGKGGCWKKASS